MAKLRQEGYEGLKNVNLSEVIASKGYNEALKYIWTEDDYSQRIKVLTPFAKNGHSLLMLELSQAFALCAAEKASKDNKPVVRLTPFASFSPDMKKAFDWYTLGHLCMNTDIQCLKIKDQMIVASLQKSADTLLTQYNPAWHVNENARATIHFEGLCEAAMKTYLSWKPSAKNPSPRWIINGIVSSEDGWLKIRNTIQKEMSNQDMRTTFSAVRVGEGRHPIWDGMMK